MILNHRQNLILFNQVPFGGYKMSGQVKNSKQQIIKYLQANTLQIQNRRVVSWVNMVLRLTLRSRRSPLLCPRKTAKISASEKQLKYQHQKNSNKISASEKQLKYMHQKNSNESALVKKLKIRRISWKTNNCGINAT